MYQNHLPRIPIKKLAACAVNTGTQSPSVAHRASPLGPTSSVTVWTAPLPCGVHTNVVNASRLPPTPRAVDTGVEDLSPPQIHPTNGTAGSLEGSCYESSTRERQEGDSPLDWKLMGCSGTRPSDRSPAVYFPD